jgi:hypothetical protein
VRCPRNIYGYVLGGEEDKKLLDIRLQGFYPFRDMDGAIRGGMVRCPRNIYEYVLGGEEDKKLLDIRIFEESTKRAAYKRQTEAAEKQGISNCPLCALGNNANKTRIYKLSEMDADHVTAWSKGGATSMENCEMLCKTHNRSKGNR